MDNNPQATISQILPGFVEYMAVERQFSPATVKKYHDNVRWFVRDVGNLGIQDLCLTDFISLKTRMTERGARAARIAGVIFAVKGLLIYARDYLGLSVLDLKSIKAPREARREVVYLTEAEIDQFMHGIYLHTPLTHRDHLAGYCFRALVEILLASGMRISEALALNRDSIDGENREALIVGKGNKERTVFFTPRSLKWLERYLARRSDTGQAMFASTSGCRLTVAGVETTFRRVSQRAGMEKSVTPHMLRHTAATNLLHKGCPVGFIKEVLGHQRLETTCRFYLGMLNKVDTKKAFDSYMIYNSAETDPTCPRLPPDPNLH
jgi:integrase/recombinase XerD